MLESVNAPVLPEPDRLPVAPRTTSRPPRRKTRPGRGHIDHPGGGEGRLGHRHQIGVRLIDRVTAIGDFAIANTGGWQTSRSVAGNVPVGRHTVCLTFSSTQPADFVAVNWFTFRT